MDRPKARRLNQFNRSVNVRLGETVHFPRGERCAVPDLWRLNRGGYHEAEPMHFGDYIFIFVLGLVLFGPKKLPEIGRQVGKLLAEFRRASNEFKFQIQEEIRNMEEEERRKKLAETRAAAAAAATPAPSPAAPSILPPSTGAPVGTERPFAAPVQPAEPLPVSPDLALNSAALVTESTGDRSAKDDTPGSIEVPASNGSHPVAGEISEPASASHD